MAASWINFNNGDTGFAVRTALNTFNTAITLNMSNAEGRLDNTESATSGNTTDIGNLDTRVGTAESDIVVLKAPASTKYTPQAVRPTYSEGQIYYDANKHVMLIDGPIEGVDVKIGHGVHTHVLNNSGAPIEKGMAVRHAGVASGVVQIEKAIATSFENARVFGIVAKDIPIGQEGSIITFGELSELDTFANPVGVPLYLSDTIAGTYTDVAPDIVSRIGGILVQDAIAGSLFVAIINNKILPPVLGGLQGQTGGEEVYAVTTVAQDVNDYTLEESVVMTTNVLTGVLTLPYTGKYRVSVGASIEFPSSISTRNITFEVYNATTATPLFSFVKNIPRDATIESFSFGAPFTGIINNEYKVRIKASESISITMNDISFDIQSISIIE